MVKLAPDALTPLRDDMKITGMSDVGLHPTGLQGLYLPNFKTRKKSQELVTETSGV